MNMGGCPWHRSLEPDEYGGNLGGGTWGSFGGCTGGPRGPFFRASREGPGVLLGGFLCSGVVLGSVLGSLNVAILLILDMF